MTEKLLEIQNLTKTYYEGTTECRVVDNVDLIVNRGEFVMIMGASGKTSLLHLIAGIDESDTELVMDLLNELNRNGQTIVLVSHDRKVAVRGQRVVYIEDGHIAGELRFRAAMSDDSSRELYDERESELTHFLQNRGW